MKFYYTHSLLLRVKVKNINVFREHTESHHTAIGLINNDARISQKRR